MQAIIVLGLPEMGFYGQSALKAAPLVDSGEVFPTHGEVWEDIPSEQVVGRSDRAKSTWVRCNRPLLPEQLLLNSHICPQGEAPLMERKYQLLG